jgi:general secretion pathway protein F
VSDAAVASYRFRAVRPDGAIEEGAIVATSRENAVALVAGQGLHPVQVSRLARGLPTGLGAGATDQALGLRALATLLGAGLPTSRAFAVLEGIVPPCWMAAIPALRTQIENGSSLAAALRTSPLALPPHVIAIIEAGEESGGIATAVENAAELLEARAEASAALWNALSYPILLAVSGAASIALLVGLVLPRFATLLTDSGATLPLTTRLMLGVAQTARGAAIPALYGVVLGAFAWRVWTARPAGRRQWHALLLSLPLAGPTRRSAVTARACATLAALLSTGVSLSAALPLAARSTGDAAMEEALLAARRRIVEGEAFSGALQAERALTRTAVRFARIGEETGELDAMLGRAARVESADALRRLKQLTRLIEPTMILLFGGMVMLVAAALLQAIYGLRLSP